MASRQVDNIEKLMWVTSKFSILFYYPSLLGSIAREALNAHEAREAIICSRRVRRRDESELMSCFAKVFGCLWICNEGGGWNRVMIR